MAQASVQLGTSGSSDPHRAMTPTFPKTERRSMVGPSRAGPSRFDRVGVCVHVFHQEGHVYGRGLLSGSSFPVGNRVLN